MGTTSLVRYIRMQHRLCRVPLMSDLPKYTSGPLAGCLLASLLMCANVGWAGAPSPVSGTPPKADVDLSSTSLRARVQPAHEDSLNAFSGTDQRAQAHQLSDREWALVERAIDALPALHRQILQQRLARLSFVDAPWSPGTALTREYDGADGKPLFEITLRRRQHLEDHRRRRPFPRDMDRLPQLGRSTRSRPACVLRLPAQTSSAPVTGTNALSGSGRISICVVVLHRFGRRRLCGAYRLARAIAEFRCRINDLDTRQLRQCRCAVRPTRLDIGPSAHGQGKCAPHEARAAVRL